MIVLQKTLLNTHLKIRDLHCIAFYNTENFFEAFSQDSKTTDKKWTEKRYQKKLTNIGYAISFIGRSKTNKHPAIIGLAEIENTIVLEDLIASKHLLELSYKYIFFPSKDKRGINIALLYDSNLFQVETAKPISLKIKDTLGNPEFTRDILLVSGFLEGIKIYIIMNHWPSQREKNTAYKREKASLKVAEIITSIYKEDKEAQLIIMGDFNENPTSKSVKQLANTFKLQNPFKALKTYTSGSTSYNKQWHVFDQILLSKSFIDKRANNLKLKDARIFDDTFLKNHKGKHKGFPNRTFIGSHYHGGFSDHFPVYVLVE